MLIVALTVRCMSAASYIAGHYRPPRSFLGVVWVSCTFRRFRARSGHGLSHCVMSTRIGLRFMTRRCSQAKRGCMATQKRRAGTSRCRHAANNYLVYRCRSGQRRLRSARKVSSTAEILPPASSQECCPVPGQSACQVHRP